MLLKNMQIVLDTSTLIRFFTNDIPQKAGKVEKLIENEKHIVLPDVVFPELEYVLTSAYILPRTKILDAYRFLLSRENIKISPYIKKAVETFSKTSLDMADCIIASQASKGKLASFDKELLEVENINPLWK